MTLNRPSEAKVSEPGPKAVGAIVHTVVVDAGAATVAEFRPDFGPFEVGPINW